MVNRAVVHLPLFASELPLDKSLVLEPIRDVLFSLGKEEPLGLWQRVSNPRLNQIESLTLCLDAPALDHACQIATEIISDPNFVSIRQFSLIAGGFGIEEMDVAPLRAPSKANVRVADCNRSHSVPSTNWTEIPL